MSSEALNREEKDVLAVRRALDMHSDWDASEAFERLLAALAVAREREQRAVDALNKIMQLPYGGVTPATLDIVRAALANPVVDAVVEFRAALVDEPAAATLAEPG